MDQPQAGIDPNLVTSPADAALSVSSVTVGGVEIPIVKDSSCKTCESPYRHAIERLLSSKGMSYKSVMEALPPEAKITVAAIKKHVQDKHMPYTIAQAHATVAVRARELGRDIEEATTSVVTGLALADEVVKKTFEKLVEGNLEPEISDGMAAAKFVAEAERNASEVGIDRESIYMAFYECIQAAKRFMQPDHFDHFLQSLRSNPVIAGVANRAEAIESTGEEVPSDLQPAETQDMIQHPATQTLF